VGLKVNTDSWRARYPLIENPPENSMTSFNFTNAVLDEGTTFTFCSWFCITNGRGGFNSDLAATSTTSPIISAKFDFPI
jgi:hypothetical protein